MQPAGHQITVPANEPLNVPVGKKDIVYIPLLRCLLINMLTRSASSKIYTKRNRIDAPYPELWIGHPYLKNLYENRAVFSKHKTGRKRSGVDDERNTYHNWQKDTNWLS